MILSGVVTKTWLYLYPPPLSVNPALIEVTEYLKSTTADVDVKLPTSLATIHQGDIYTPIPPLDVDQSATKWIVVGVSVYIRTVIDNMRHSAHVVPCVIPPAACSNPGFIPSQIATEGVFCAGTVCVVPPAGTGGRVSMALDKRRSRNKQG